MQTSLNDSIPSVRIEYARRFAVNRINGYDIITVRSPWPGSVESYAYILKTSDNTNPIPDIPGAQVINTPVRNIVCYSTTHLPFLEMIGEQEKLIAFPTTSYISSPVFRKMATDGRIQDLGPTSEINFEKLITLNPGLVMAYTMGNDLGMIQKIILAGIPLVLNADYLENHPLGRAEWIKFTGLFFRRAELADSIFNSIRSRYLEYSGITAGSTDRPTVVTGVVYGDTWFLPGGRNYASIFFRDAGARYLWEDNLSESILQLSFEAVYERASGSDYWIGTASYETRQMLRNADSRYAEFKPFNTGRVYNYSARINPEGGNEYFEKGYARPDLVLADLAAIFHPEVMKGHKLYFYRKIE
ncbi:MAG TPA: ABC transporter substrate-binding protein [Cyclobacteriaceae bacterium]|nr:ABC transporter substrate-binding protein [Cyclobacteriaceae bacterium]